MKADGTKKLQGKKKKIDAQERNMHTERERERKEKRKENRQCLQDR